MISVPDERYVVINAITKRDLARAKKLTETLSDEESEPIEKTFSSKHQQGSTGQKLLGVPW